MSAPSSSPHKLAATVLSPALVAQIDAIAEKEGVSRSAIIRRAVLRDLKRTKKSEGA